MSTQSETNILPRTGQPPLRVVGILVARASSRQTPTKKGRPLETRWHDLTVYRSDSGQTVGHISYRTEWPGELDDALARVAPIPDLVRWLEDHDPTGAVVGFPAGKGFADRQSALLTAIEHGYDRALSELLAGLGVTETVE